MTGRMLKTDDGDAVDVDYGDYDTNDSVVDDVDDDGVELCLIL